MPAYAKRSRPALLALATPLIDAARKQRAEATVHEAADAAELARMGLEDALRGTRLAGADLSDAARAALAAEGSLDRRVRGLHRALEGLAALGDGDAEALADRLFPAGSEPATRPAGRAQVPEYTLLSANLAANADHPALARLEPHPTALRADLGAFLDALRAKTDTHADRRAASGDAAAAAEALRDALQQLDRAVELAAGGPSTEGYRAWAAAAAGLG
jgi:hypothetical protein